MICAECGIRNAELAMPVCDDSVILGIETSCDETAAALIVDGRITSDCTTRQVIHESYGGVVPELASRAHEKLLTRAVESVLRDSEMNVNDITGIAVTMGPGLAGSLLVGLAFAKGLARALSVPMIGINHLEGHLWSSELQHGVIPLPFMALLISGGHTIMVKVIGFGRYEILGSTRDDAVGELFDKVGRMLGFNFPAGESIDREACSYMGESVHFPRAKISDDPLGFSFSGLKTAVLYYLQGRYTGSSDGFNLQQKDRSAVCVGLMEAVGDMLVRGLDHAVETGDYKALVVSGGVSASRFLRGRFDVFAHERSLPLYIPDHRYCTDNGSMVAYAGYRRFALGQSSSKDIDINPSLTLTDSLL